MPGIRLIVNPINLGYLRSCNTAARVAKGEFLLLLNNDTQVHAGLARSAAVAVPDSQ